MPTRPVPEPERDADELDEELDLPPADDDDERDGGDGHTDELPDELDDPGGLDDANAGDLDVGGEDLEEDDEKHDDAEGDVDVGALDEDIVVDEQKHADHEADGLGEEDHEVAADLPGEDDGGAEGTSEDPGADVDEGALPDLDDDAGEGGDDRLADELLAESESMPWSDARWATQEGAGAPLPCCAVAAAAGRVAAAGEVLLMVDDGARAAHTLPFGEASVAIALSDDALLAATARGQLFVARAHGAEAVSLGSWRAGIGPSMGLWPAESGAPVELAATPGRFWIRAGAALLQASSTQPPAPVRERGVLAITASRGALIALTTGPSGPAIERFRSDDEGWAATPLQGEARSFAERDRSALRIAAAGGRAVAISDQERVAFSRDGGATFTTIDLGTVPSIAFAGDTPDAPLLALVAPRAAGGADPSPTASAFVVELGDQGVTRIGEIPSPNYELGAADGGSKPAPASPWATAALAWDASRDLVWVACAGGLIAFGRPQKH